MQYRTPSMAQGVFYTYWFEKNLQGDIVAVYNEAGTKIISYVYDAWGNFSAIAGNTTGTNTYAGYNPFRYRGYYYDTETGYYYLNSRYYNPQWGRFISADAIGYLGAEDEILGYNLFAYCGNNPVMGYDPEGTWDWGKFRKAVTSGVAFVTTLVCTANITKAKQSAVLAVGLIDLHYSRLNLEGDFPDEINPNTYKTDYADEYLVNINAQCHQFSAEKGTKNIKIVSLDGHYEAIYDAHGNKVTDPRDIGTYNICNPNTNPIGHFAVDIVPWILWGNSAEDSTNIFSRTFSCVRFW